MESYKLYACSITNQQGLHCILLTTKCLASLCHYTLLLALSSPDPLPLQSSQICCVPP